METIIFMVMVILVSLAVTFFILLFEKWGFRNYIIEHSKIKLLSDMLSCDLCLCFWTSVVISLLASLFIGIEAFAIPIFSTPLARRLL